MEGDAGVAWLVSSSIHQQQVALAHTNWLLDFFAVVGLEGRASFAPACGGAAESRCSRHIDDYWLASSSSWLLSFSS
jgi:hypothetical protein